MNIIIFENVKSEITLKIWLNLVDIKLERENEK